MVFTASGNVEWLYYKEYPWVWDDKTADWLFLRGGEDGKIYAYRNSTTEWEEFNVQEVENTWDAQYAEWIKDPEPYGGLSVLQQIKKAKESGATDLVLLSNNISDLTPLAGLTNLVQLNLKENNLSDLSPLSELTSLLTLDVEENEISDLSPLANLDNLINLAVGGNKVTEILALSNLLNLVELDIENNQISDLSPLSSLTNLEQLKLHDNNLSVISPLSSLEKLIELDIGNNEIADISALTNLPVLSELQLDGNPITASQKAMLEEALPNTYISWPNVIIDDILDTTPPEITILSYSGHWPSYNGRGGGEEEFPTFSYSAIDNVDGDLTEKVEVTTRFVSGFIDGAEWGWTEVIFSVTDAASNTSTHTESGPSEPVGYTP
ncbi:MAG: hypothetical protein P8N49_04190 [Opitutales bacterium]|nr:hypothetical protein [Opitutales bacterium]